MDYFVHGYAAGIGIIVNDDSVTIDLLWIDSYCPPTVDVPGLGIITIHPDAVNKAGTFSIINTTVPLKKHDQAQITV